MNAPEKYFQQLAIQNATTRGRALPGAIEPIAFARFVSASLEVSTPAQFAALARGELQPLLPHGMLLAGVGHAQVEAIVVHQAIGVNYPRPYLDKLKRERAWAGPVLARWLRSGAPQLFDVVAPAYRVPARWLDAARRHALRNIAAHGIRDINGNGASYFSFSQLPGALGKQHVRLLRIVTPLLHQALHAALRAQPEAKRGYAHAIPLTGREREILAWLAAGKSNAAIAHILNRSQYTVRNQVSALLAKLGAGNRAQAVAAAGRLNLLP